jgi:hypothetical protein
MYNTVFSEHYINSERGDNSKKAKKSIILKNSQKLIKRLKINESLA